MEILRRNQQVDGVAALDPTCGVGLPLEDPDQIARMRAMLDEVVEPTDDESRGQEDEEEEREEEPASQEPIFPEWGQCGRGRGGPPHQSHRLHHPITSRSGAVGLWTTSSTLRPSSRHCHSQTPIWWRIAGGGAASDFPTVGERTGWRLRPICRDRGGA